MNYTTEAVIMQIEARNYRRQEAVYLSQRIHKANKSPGFDWERAIKGFSLKFKGEVWEAKTLVNEQYPDSPFQEIDWVEIIVYFAGQPYNKGETNDNL